MKNINSYINEKLKITTDTKIGKDYLEWSDICSELKNFNSKFGLPKDGSKNEFKPNNCYYCDSDYYFGTHGNHDIMSFIYMTNNSNSVDIDGSYFDGDYIICICLDDYNNDFYIYGDLLTELSDYDGNRIDIFKRKDMKKISRHLFNEFKDFLNEIYITKNSSKFEELCYKYNKNFE